MKGFLISLLVEPIAALFFLGGPVLLALLIWRYMPDSKIKRLLFKSWGHDRGPWMRQSWQRAKGRRKDAALPPRKPESLP